MIRSWVVLFLALVPAVVCAAQAPQSTPSGADTSPVVGTWTLTAAERLLPDGTRVADYGPSPHGLVIFTADGYYSSRSTAPNAHGFPPETNSKGLRKNTRRPRSA